MRIREPGQITETLWFLGTMESCVYLLEGVRESILINAGLSCVVPKIIAQLREYDIDESKITKILMLHSHFDHVGIAPFFKRRHPEITILASARAWNALKKPKVLKSINDANQYVIRDRNLVDACSGYDLNWNPEIIGKSISDGDRIDLGDLEIQILATPGHSPCSISAYVPELKILFPSEAGGMPCGDKIITYGTSNYTEFESSIQKLKKLPVNYICSDHYGYVKGDEVDNFIEKSIQETSKRRILMKNIYKQTGSVDKATNDVVAQFWDENNLNLVPDDVFFEAHRQMILHVIGRQ